VTTEAFSQWIVEDAFCGSRPPLESVGVQFVADVEPFELVKKRLLNGTHCAIAYLGLMAGLETPAQAMSDPSLGPFTARLMDEEVVPLLPRTTGLDVAAYARTVRRRLANPRIGDQLERLSARGATKVPAYLLPSLAAARRARRPFRLLALAVAGWLVAADRSAHDPLLGELAGEPEVVAAVRTLRSEGVRGALSRSLSAPLEVAA
jgi:mannitol-1-phosphate/altronate dehydrogenase